MTRAIAIIACLAAAACGGKSAPRAAPPPDDDDGPGERVEPFDDEVEDEPAPPPPPPRELVASAALAPVKGSKMKAAQIWFSQVEGEPTAVAADPPLDGLKAGRYHLVIHEGGECGKNGAKAGKPWAPAADAALVVEVVKGQPAAVEAGDLPLALEGDATIVGRTLVVHADRKGKPGKVEACGVITAEGAGGDDEEE